MKTSNSVAEPRNRSERRHPDELLGVSEMEAEYSWSAGTLYVWRHRGTGPPSTRLGRRVFWRRSDVEGWIAEQEAAERRRRETP